MGRAISSLWSSGMIAFERHWNCNEGCVHNVAHRKTKLSIKDMLAGYRQRIIEAFGRWLHLIPFGRLPPSELAHHPLTDAAVEALKSESCFDEAVEVTVELIYATSDNGNPGADAAVLVNRIVPEVTCSSYSWSTGPDLRCLTFIVIQSTNEKSFLSRAS